MRFKVPPQQWEAFGARNEELFLSRAPAACLLDDEDVPGTAPQRTLIKHYDLPCALAAAPTSPRKASPWPTPPFTRPLLVDRIWLLLRGRIEPVCRTGRGRYPHELFLHPLRTNSRRNDVPAKLLSRLNHLLKLRSANDSRW